MNRTNIIIELIKLSTSYQCEHITYKESKDNVIITSNNTRGLFCSTELCIQLSSFKQFFRINDEGVIELVVY